MFSSFWSMTSYWCIWYIYCHNPAYVIQCVKKAKKGLLWEFDPEMKTTFWIFTKHNSWPFHANQQLYSTIAYCFVFLSSKTLIHGLWTHIVYFVIQVRKFWKKDYYENSIQKWKSTFDISILFYTHIYSKYLFLFAYDDIYFELIMFMGQYIEL